MFRSLGPVHAPEIALEGLVWLNSPGPLALADLRGRLVILDFWTFCCINCMHVLPALRAVEAAFPDRLTVIGVHSPKFTAEQDVTNVAQALARYDVVHPVIHDPAFRLWTQYGVRAWPTLVFIGPDGDVLGQHAGEVEAEGLKQAVASMLEGWEKQDRLVLTPLPIHRTDPAAGGLPAPGRLCFPGKIKALPPLGAGPDTGLRAGAEEPAGWVVADAGHHQIVALDRAGQEQARYGSGAAGFQEGGAETAQFCAPQGLTADGEAIYVADTGNHALRRIDRRSGRVTTLAGTGRRGLPLLPGPEPGSEMALASPWDIAQRGSKLYIANAGTHQLGLFDLEAGTVQRLAGSGTEALRDGPAQGAHLAQPSGLALAPDGRRLFFVDSETSSVRLLILDADGIGERVETLAGTGLFDFGHRDGPLSAARFQHPLGIAWLGPGSARRRARDHLPAGGRLVVADSYNGTLRQIDLDTATVRDLEEGFVCTDPACLPPGEPAGVVAEGPERILVADTNNHRLLVYDLKEKRYGCFLS